MIITHIDQTIGNTPLLKIPGDVHGIENVELYAKLEHLNPFGSLKDRIAKEMLIGNIQDIASSGKTVLESSSGNTVKALAALCGIYGVPLRTITNRIKIDEVRMTLQLLGSDVEELAGVSECPDPNNPETPVAMAAKLASIHADKYHHTDQYFNQANINAHKKTGKEIVEDLQQIDYFIGFLGTCGSTVGVGEYLREHCNNDVKIIGVVSNDGEYLPGGRTESELYETGFFDKKFYDGIAKGSVKEAIEGMLTLSRRCGVFCGPTSGLNYMAAVKLLQSLPIVNHTRKAVFIVCDRAETYLHYVKKYKPEIFSETTQGLLDLTSEEIASAESITPMQLHTESDALIVDIRSPYSYSLGHIPGSINIPEDLLEQMLSNGNPFSDGKNVVFVCPIGRISMRYAAIVARHGIKSASLVGGIQAWKDKNGPIGVSQRYNHSKSDTKSIEEYKEQVK